MLFCAQTVQELHTLEKSMHASPVDQPQRQEHLFVLRVWYETGEAGPGQWRGYVTHAQSGTRLPVTCLEDMLDFVLLRMEDTQSDLATSFLKSTGEKSNE